MGKYYRLPPNDEQQNINFTNFSLRAQLVLNHKKAERRKAFFKKRPYFGPAAATFYRKMMGKNEIIFSHLYAYLVHCTPWIDRTNNERATTASSIKHHNKLTKIEAS